MADLRKAINANRRAISTSNIERFIPIDLGTIGDSQEDKLLFMFGSMCAEFKVSKEILYGAFKPWIEESTIDSSRDVIGRIFRIEHFQNKPDVVRILMETAKVEFNSAVMSIAGYPHEGTETTLPLLDYCYPNEHIEVYKKTLSDISPGKHLEFYTGDSEELNLGKLDEYTSVEYVTDRNLILEEYLTNKIKELEKYAEIPKYILPDRIPLQGHRYKYDKTSEVKAIPNAENLSEMLTNVVEKYSTRGLTTEEIEAVKNELTEVIKESTATTFIYRLSQPIYQALFLSDDDNDLVKKFGPANTFVLEEFIDIVRSSRMFTCTKFIEENPDDDNSFENYEPSAFSWFTGSCQQCLKKIRAYHHAVRVPMEGGGWRGCFCSWKCVRRFIGKPKDEMEELFLPEGIQLNLTDFFENKIKDIGIYDRPYKPEKQIGRDKTISELYGRRQTFNELNPKKARKPYDLAILRGSDVEATEKEEWSTTKVDVRRLILKGIIKPKGRSGRSNLSVGSIDSMGSPESIAASSSTVVEK